MHNHRNLFLNIHITLHVAEFSGPHASCEDSIGCMHGSSEPDLRNWKSPTPQFTQGARPDEHP
ncbi:hypothetical protein L560_1951 [Bordetella pertussis STO1-CHOC-0018]|nr:hypothetical protein L559_1818 [Bordetella pertussis STO1-CHOC-0017]ETH87635.1 hypothetical protein L560_1951 [Bordetella pertussis STO1-CHOC-0018]